MESSRVENVETQQEAAAVVTCVGCVQSYPRWRDRSMAM